MSICLFLINKVIRNQNKTCYHFQDSIGHVIFIFLQNIHVQNTYRMFYFYFSYEKKNISKIKACKALRQRKISDFFLNSFHLKCPLC